MRGEKTLIIGANGQIGTELVAYLSDKLGVSQVVAADIRASDVENDNAFELLDVTDAARLKEVVEKHSITHVYQLAALLSATAEKKPVLAWDLNMQGLFNILNLAKEGHVAKVFWPSSIAVFGPTTPPNNVPQNTITQPTSVYGISKLAGERWCEYYHSKWGVDVRGIRYPGLVGFKSLPGGGTTDYAVDIFHHALDNGRYTSFLQDDTSLPMMYMEDAIKATYQLMNSPAEEISVRSSYNIDSLSFTPKILAEEIKRTMPDFAIDYAPDFRQELADSWPNSIDGSIAAQDWGWKNQTDLKSLVSTMIEGIRSNRNILNSMS